MGDRIESFIKSVSVGKYKKFYNIFVMVFVAIFIIRTVAILSAPKPYLSAGNTNANNVLKEDSSDNSKNIEVKFKDEKFEYKIRSILGVFNRPIMDKDLRKIVSMDLNHNHIEDLEGIQYCTNLKNINLSSNNIKDISGLKNVTKLEKLNLYDNKVEDISSLEQLINLKELDLARNNIKDITYLKNLINLKKLDLYSNRIENIDVLKSLKNIIFLDVSRNNIKDITPLKHMKLKEVLYWGNDTSFNKNKN